MRALFIVFLFFTFVANADDVSEYRYYQINRSGSYVAYIKKDDPCVYAGYIKENDIHKYCKFSDSGINLEVDYPTAYVSRFSLFSSKLRITVTAPWNEQKCLIDLDENSISCESTGKK